MQEWKERKMEAGSPCKKLLSLSRWEVMKVRISLFVVEMKKQRMNSKSF